jgi:hypothetical protein
MKQDHSYNLYNRAVMWYIRLVLLWQSVVELWNRVFFVAVVIDEVEPFIRIRGQRIKLQLYPCVKTNGFLIGDSYFTTNQRYAIVQESPEDQD